MGWWGKLVGGALGFAMGGPLGALLGAALGHNIDQGMAGSGRDWIGAGDQARIQTAFFTATFSIMGHLAKADGRVSPEEIAMAEQVMSQMRLNEEQRKAAVKLFQEGKSADFPLDEVLVQLRQECHRRRNLMQMFLEILISTALADGRFDPNEEQLLYRIGDGLGFPKSIFDRLIAMVRAQQRFSEKGSAGMGQASTKDAYDVIGVSTDVSNETVKRAYRRLMNQHHPDKLVSKGLPEEMIRIATEKTQEIKAAYDRIKQERNL